MTIFKTHIPDLGFPPSVPNSWFPQTESPFPTGPFGESRIPIPDRKPSPPIRVRYSSRRL